MKLNPRLKGVFVFFFLLTGIFITQTVYAKCTPKEVIELGKMGMSLSKIENLCGMTGAHSGGQKKSDNSAIPNEKESEVTEPGTGKSDLVVTPEKLSKILCRFFESGKDISTVKEIFPNGYLNNEIYGEQVGAHWFNDMVKIGSSNSNASLFINLRYLKKKSVSQLSIKTDRDFNPIFDSPNQAIVWLKKYFKKVAWNKKDQDIFAKAGYDEDYGYEFEINIRDKYLDEVEFEWDRRVDKIGLRFCN